MHTLKTYDPEVSNIIGRELKRQQDGLELIASENIVSRAILEAQGSVLTNKYAEGYPAKRYYGGCEFVDEVEQLAIERLKKIFGCQYANVQAHSGSQANQAVYLANLKPGDAILGMSLDAGGHLTHGSPVNLSGKWLQAHHYGVSHDTGLIDYNEVESVAQQHRPKLIIAGASAYPRALDFKAFRTIADKVGAIFMVDMAHIAGLVAGSMHESPFPYADVVTSTTHKTLRGPRGGVILTNQEDMAKKINLAIFPGLQGGPLMHVIAAKAVAFKEVLEPSFKDYARAVVANAQALARALLEKGFRLVTGGTDNHLLLVDLRPQGLKGNVACDKLQEAYISCNKNTIPFDTEKAFVTSGIRLGTPACTTRGLDEAAFTHVGHIIAQVLTGGSLDEARQRVQDLCARYPIYEE